MVYKRTLFGIHIFCFSHYHQITVTNALTETYWLSRVMHASSKQFNDMNLLICKITFSLINLLIPVYAKYDLPDFVSAWWFIVSVWAYPEAGTAVLFTLRK